VEVRSVLEGTAGSWGAAVASGGRGVSVPWDEAPEVLVPTGTG